MLKPQFTVYIDKVNITNVPLSTLKVMLTPNSFKLFKKVKRGGGTLKLPYTAIKANLRKQ